jgi:hypothetical protein
VYHTASSVCLVSPEKTQLGQPHMPANLDGTISTREFIEYVLILIYAELNIQYGIKLVDLNMYPISTKIYIAHK